MICGHWVQKIWIFVRFLEAVMSKLHIKFPSEVFGEKFFFWKNNAFLSIKFRTLSKKSEFLSEKFRRVFQTYDQYAIRNILKTNLWEKHCIKDLRTLKQDFLNVCRNFCSCLVKTALLVSVGSFWGLRFFSKKQCFFGKNSERSAKQFEHPVEYCLGVVKTTICVSRRTIWWKTVMFEVFYTVR